MGKLTSTHTYAVLEVSREAYEEIKSKLETAGYQDQFHEDDEFGVVIDMHGVAVAKASTRGVCVFCRKPRGICSLCQQAIEFGGVCVLAGGHEHHFCPSKEASKDG